MLEGKNKTVSLFQPSNMAAVKTLYSNSWLQQKIPKFGLRTHTPLNFGQAWLPARIFTFLKTTAHGCESGLLGPYCLHCRSNFGDLYFRHSSNDSVEFANFRNKRRFRWCPVYRLFLYVTLTRHRYPLKALFIFQLFSSGYPIEYTQIFVRHHIAYFQLNLCRVCYYVLSKVRPGCQVFQAIDC